LALVLIKEVYYYLHDLLIELLASVSVRMGGSLTRRRIRRARYSSSVLAGGADWVCN